MTTTLERLDRATHQRKWTDELRQYRDEAADRWMGVWTEWREQAAALHTDPPSVVPQEWPEPRHVQRYRLWKYAVEHGKLTELEAYYEASLDDTRDWAVFVDADDLIQPTSVIPAERPATQGEKDVAVLKANVARLLARPRANPTENVPLPVVADEDLAGVPILPRMPSSALAAAHAKAITAQKAGWTPDKPAESAGEYIGQGELEDEPWWRRAWRAVVDGVVAVLEHLAQERRQP